MKRQIVAISIALLMLSGCTATPAPAPAPAATPTPTPVAMSIAEASQFYLDAVCPGNGAFSDLDAALQAAELSAITSTGATARDLFKSRAQIFDDDTILWPAVISADDLKAIVDRSLDSAALFDTLSSAASVDDAYEAVTEWNDAPDTSVRDAGLAASLQIRAQLGLPEDTEKGC